MLKLAVNKFLEKMAAKGIHIPWLDLRNIAAFSKAEGMPIGERLGSALRSLGNTAKEIEVPAFGMGVLGTRFGAKAGGESRAAADIGGQVKNFFDKGNSLDFSLSKAPATMLQKLKAMVGDAGGDEAAAVREAIDRLQESLMKGQQPKMLPTQRAVLTDTGLGNLPAESALPTVGRVPASEFLADRVDALREGTGFTIKNKALIDRFLAEHPGLRSKFPNLDEVLSNPSDELVRSLAMVGKAGKDGKGAIPTSVLDSVRRFGEGGMSKQDLAKAIDLGLDDTAVAKNMLENLDDSFLLEKATGRSADLGKQDNMQNFYNSIIGSSDYFAEVKPEIIGRTIRSLRRAGIITPASTPQEIMHALKRTIPI